MFNTKSKNKKEKLKEIVFGGVNLRPNSLFDNSELELSAKLLNVLDFLSTQKKATIIAIDDFHHINQMFSNFVNKPFFSDLLKKRRLMKMHINDILLIFLMAQRPQFLKRV